MCNKEVLKLRTFQLLPIYNNGRLLIYTKEHICLICGQIFKVTINDFNHTIIGMDKINHHFDYHYKNNEIKCLHTISISSQIV